MAVAAIYIASNQFSVADENVARFVVKRRVLAYCGADSFQQGVVSSVSDTTITLSMDAGNALTANLVSVQHGNDTPASLANHGHTGQADGGFIAVNPQWRIPAGETIPVGDYQQYRVAGGQIDIIGTLSLGAGAQLIVEV